MRRVVSLVAALAVPAMMLGGSLVAADDKKAKDKDLDKPAADQWIKTGSITGKVMAVYEDKRRLRLQITFVTPKLNPGAVTGMAQAQAAMSQASARRDIRGMMQAQQQMAQHQRNLYTLDKQSKEIEFQAIDDVVVRTVRPREAFDEKGKIKKFTKAELKELKGPDPKLPGYKAEFGDLTAEQVLKMTVVRKKGTPAPKPKPRARKGKDDDNLDADMLDDTPQVSMIMILADPPPGK
jgi:hypothetical protein